MAKQAYVYSGTEWVPLASEVTNLSAYQTKALNQFPYRNLIINGAMQVAQRGTSTASITSGSNYVVDRWKFQVNTQGTWTMSQEDDAPTGSGFRKSTKLLCTTADASPAAGDYVLFNQTLEGQNVQHIKKGTASAEQLTLSFWVKSNVTGTYIVELRDQDNTRQVSKSYTISASGVWEYKTITFPADTTGPLDNDNNLSLFPIWWLGAGSNFTSGSLATTWASGTDANKAVGQTNLASATNNYWQITGVQLEVGATATPFEFKPIDAELAQCQRYYWAAPQTDQTGAGDGATIFGGYMTTGGTFVGLYNTKVSMRIRPSIVTSGSSNLEVAYADASAVSASATSLTLEANVSSTDTVVIAHTGFATTRGGQVAFLRYASGNTASPAVALNAEL